MKERLETKDTIRLGVLKLMREDERCRNDDKWLIWKYLRECAGVKIFIPFKQFDKMPSFESIRRIRQHIQNTEGKLLPTVAHVRRERRISFAAWKEWLNKAWYIWGLDR